MILKTAAIRNKKNTFKRSKRVVVQFGKIIGMKVKRGLIKCLIIVQKDHIIEHIMNVMTIWIKMIFAIRSQVLLLIMKR